MLAETGRDDIDVRRGMADDLEHDVALRDPADVLEHQVREPNTNPSPARYNQIGARIRTRFPRIQAPQRPILDDFTGGLTELDIYSPIRANGACQPPAPGR